MTNQKKYWQTRSEKYDELNWVSYPKWISEIVTATEFDKNDLVLDVGTGTGIIAEALSFKVKSVIGIDFCEDMIKKSQYKDSVSFILRDIRDPLFNNEIFDKVTARMVFHHIIEDTQKAMDECYRVLKKGGKMILSESIPPSPEVKEDFVRIFSFKEERLTFLEEDLIKMMKNSGFKNIKINFHTMENFSVKNWLEKSGLSQKNQDKIFEMHVTNSETFKNAYNMKIINGDCLIDVKNIILVGEK